MHDPGMQAALGTLLLHCKAAALHALRRALQNVICVAPSAEGCSALWWWYAYMVWNNTAHKASASPVQDDSVVNIRA
jgi:hypothetical protein